MEINRIIFDYYEKEIKKIKIPHPVIPENNYKAARNRIRNLIFAAAIALSGIPFIMALDTPSSLAVKAAEFSEYHNLNTIIPAGLSKINIIVSNTINPGGNQ